MLTSIILAVAVNASAASACHLGDEAGCKSACDSGDQRACVVLGTMYVDAVGVDRDSKRGDALFVRGCKAGDGDACNAHGMRLREKVLEGVLGWESTLGFFEKACAADSAKGCNNAAAAIVDGHAGSRAAADGAALFRKSCELQSDGSATGCFEYGQALKMGRAGLAHDDVLAAKWLARACRLGAGEACSMADDLGEHVELSAAQRSRLEIARCDNGDVKACAHYGASLLSKDKPAAAEALRVACIGEDATACSDLAKAVPDSLEGASALDKACNLDDAAGCRMLGDQLLVGHVVARDQERAMALLQKACKLGAEKGCAHASGIAMANSIKRTGDDVAGTVFTKECKSGDAESCASLQQSSKPVIAVAGSHGRASNDVERACEGGTARACFDAGKALVSKKESDERARYFFDLGCKAGYPRSCTEAGRFFDAGRGGAQDKDAAVEAFAHGCSLGNAESCAQAAATAKQLGSDAVAKARPVLAQACSRKVGAACEAKSRLE
ncbi:MAG TPA: hypothetical protein VGO62_13895 [Myxococcota bacterium]